MEYQFIQRECEEKQIGEKTDSVFSPCCIYRFPQVRQALTQLLQQEVPPVALRGMP